MTKYIKYSLVIISLLLALFFFANLTYESYDVSSISSTKNYQYKKLHSRDGIGKFYLGREIAKVMGHQEMLWLERPGREREESPQQVVENLDLRPQDVVADIGAGTGYFSFRIAKLVPQGKVYAADIQPEMLNVIEFIKKEDKVDNVTAVLGEERSPNLPNESIDLALMVDTYHELAYPQEMMEEIVKSLKPKGRVVLGEYRRENPLIQIKALHKMTENQVKKEMENVDLVWQKTEEFLPQQHLLFFSKVLNKPTAIWIINSIIRTQSC